MAQTPTSGAGEQEFRCKSNAEWRDLRFGGRRRVSSTQQAVRVANRSQQRNGVLFDIEFSTLLERGANAKTACGIHLEKTNRRPAAGAFAHDLGILQNKVLMPDCGSGVEKFDDVFRLRINPGQVRALVKISAIAGQCEIRQRVGAAVVSLKAPSLHLPATGRQRTSKTASTATAKPGSTRASASAPRLYGSAGW